MASSCHNALHKYPTINNFITETVTGEFPVQKDSNAENVSIWLRHQMYGQGVDIGNTVIESSAGL